MTEKTPPQTASQALIELAQRLTADPAYMANVLSSFQAQERLDADGMGTLLGISPDGLTCLALCKRPHPEGSDFAAQVRQIASFTGVDAGVLAQLIRQVDALEATNSQPASIAREADAPQRRPSQLGWLAAARDRSDGDDEQGQTDHQEPPDQEGEES